MPLEAWKPRPHQDVIVEYCWTHKRCNIWAHPGMGKSSSMLRLFGLLQMAGSNYFPALVIGPLAVARDVWLAEQQKWSDFAGMRVVPIIGSTPQQRIAALLLRGDIYTINYENLVWLVDYFGEKWPFRIVIADESTKLRGYRVQRGGKRAAALASVAHLTGRWINLTGTPSPHGLESLWGQQWFIDFGHRLGTSYSAFMRRWFSIDQYTKEVTPRPNARQEIYSVMGDCSIALRAEDWLPVIEPTFYEKRVTLPPEARAQYRSMERDFFADVASGGKVVAFAAVAKSGKLIQMASGSVYDTATGIAHWVHDAKVEMLRSLFDELGENLLVVYHFKFDIERIQKEFPEAVLYKGKAQEELWNSGKLPMMLVHPKSAGHGLNLQHGGRAVCFFTNNWDLELRLQVLERIGPARQLASGYNRAVLVYDIVAGNTMDVNVLDRMRGRATEQEALMAAHARSQGE